MVLRDRLASLLQLRPGAPLCVTCAGRLLHVSPKKMHEGALKLEWLPGFRRAYGRCADCDRTRIVTAYEARAASLAPGEQSAAPSGPRPPEEGVS